MFSPEVECSGNTGNAGSIDPRCNVSRPQVSLSLSAGSQDTATFSVNLDWTRNTPARQPFDLEIFQLSFSQMEYRMIGSLGTFGTFSGNLRSFGSDLGLLPNLRCDRKVVDATNSGCLFTPAAPVYVLEVNDPTVTEAALHIRQAQNGTNLYASMQASPG